MDFGQEEDRTRTDENHVILQDDPYSWDKAPSIERDPQAESSWDSWCPSGNLEHDNAATPPGWANYQGQDVRSR